jgi:hypothetical protein
MSGDPAASRQRKKLVDSLSPEERKKFDALGSEHQREGFLIVRAFAGAAAHNRDKDFANSATTSTPPLARLRFSGIPPVSRTRPMER